MATEKNHFQKLKDQIADHGLKVTSQRIAIYDALLELDHPTADEIHNFIADQYPSISLGTVYKTLDTFVQEGMIKKVKTSTDTMRYDTETTPHNHLYCRDTNEIRDYFDNDLQQIVEDYIQKNNIPNFKVEDVQIQINGRLKD